MSLITDITVYAAQGVLAGIGICTVTAAMYWAIWKAADWAKQRLAKHYGVDPDTEWPA